MRHLRKARRAPRSRRRGGRARPSHVLEYVRAHIVEVPMHAAAKALQATGPFDQFTGSLILGGFPIVEAQTCLIGASSAGQLDFMGYAVPLER